MRGDMANERAPIAKTVGQPVAVESLNPPQFGETRTSENRASALTAFAFSRTQPLNPDPIFDGDRWMLPDCNPLKTVSGKRCTCDRILRPTNS